MELIKKLIEERARTWEQAKAHLDAHADDFSGEAEETWQRMNEHLTKLDERIAELKQVADRNAAAEETRQQFEQHTPPPADDKRDKPTDSEILRRMANGEIRAYEFRDLTKGTATAGGNTVPTSFYGQLVAHMIETAAIRDTNVTVLTTDSGEDIQVPKTTAFSTATIIGEGATITESDPAFGQVTLGAFKYGFSVQVSTELEQDSGVDLNGFLAEQGGRALGNASGQHYVTGTGTGQPNGVVTAATVGVTGGTGVNGAFTADNLVDLYFSVIAPYRRNGWWLMADAGVAAARKLKDANNQYIWAPGITAGEQNTLLGRPVVVDTNIADPALGAKSVVFGDLSRYFIRDVRGVRVERSVDFAFQNDLVTWRFLFRTDGDLIDTTGAVKAFQGGAT